MNIGIAQILNNNFVYSPMWIYVLYGIAHRNLYSYTFIDHHKVYKDDLF